MNLNSVEVQQLLQQAKPAGGAAFSGRNRRAFARGFFTYLKAHLLLVALAVLFLGGVLIGTLLVSRASEPVRETLRIVTGSFLEKRSIQSFASITASTFGSTMVALFILFFCGFCTISQVIILLVPLFKGLGFGFTIGSIYAQQGTQAIGFVLVLLFPAIFLGALLLVCAAKTSFLMSLRLLRSTMTPSDLDERAQMKRYCFKYICYTVFCLLIAILDAAVFYQFSSIFLL